MLKGCQSLLLLSVVFSLLIDYASARPLRLVTLEYPPYVYSKGDHVEGVATRVVKEAFTRINQPITIEILPWARSIRYVETGNADAIYTVFKTHERTQFADYIDQVLFDQAVSFFMKKGNTIKYQGDMASLKQYSFCVVIDISYGAKFDRAVKDKVLTKIYQTRSAQQCVKMLLQGRVDLWVNNLFGALWVAKSMGVSSEIVALEPAIQSTPSYIAFSKKNGLIDVRDKFDRAIQQMKQDGTYQSTVEDYFR